MNKLYFKNKISMFLLLAILFFLTKYTTAENFQCDINKIRPVKYNQKNIYVENLQNCLLLLGYKINKNELGYYGKSTILAVKKFYKENATEIYKIAKKTNSLYQIKNWHGYSFGPSAVSYFKKLIQMKKYPTIKSSKDLSNLKMSLLLTLLSQIITTPTSTATTSTLFVSQTTTKSYEYIGGGDSTVSIPSSPLSLPQISFKHIGYILNGSKEEDIKFIYPTSDGYILFGEESSQSSNLSENSIFILRVDETRNIKLSKKFSLNNRFLSIKKVIKINEKDFLLLIESINIATLDVSTILAKISNDEIIWSKEILSSNYAIWPVNMEIIEGSNLVLLFNLKNTITGSMIGIYKTSLNNLGNILCSKSFYKRSPFFIANDLAVLNNEIFISGNYIDQNNHNNAFIIKLNNHCQFIKGVSFLLSLNKIFNHSISSFNNDLLSSGYIFSQSSNLDIFLLLLDNNFTIKWQKVYFNSDIKNISNISPINSSQFILIGNKTSESNPYFSPFLIKIDNGGNIILQKFINSSYEIIFNDAYLNPEGYLTVAGSVKFANLQNYGGLVLTSDFNFDMPFKKELDLKISPYNLTQNHVNFVKSDITFESNEVSLSFRSINFISNLIDFEIIDLY